MATRIPIPPPFGGISQQAASARHANQVEDAENVILTVADGVTLRRGTKLSAIIEGLTADAAYRLHPIERDATERYLVIYGESGSIKVLDTIAEELVPVTISDGAATYLASSTPAPSDLRLTTVADFTFILNSLVNTATLASDAYAVDSDSRDYERMIMKTPSPGTHHSTRESTGFPAGWFRYLKSGDPTYAVGRGNLAASTQSSHSYYEGETTEFTWTFTNPETLLDEDYTCTIDFNEYPLASMHDVAQAIQDSIRAAGAQNAVVEWSYDDGNQGRMRVTSPHRGAGATMPALPFTHVAGSINLGNTGINSIFRANSTYFAITDGTGDAKGKYTQAVSDRWLQVPPPEQENAVIDPDAMPVQMRRTLAPHYAADVLADSPNAYARLGDSPDQEVDDDKYNEGTGEADWVAGTVTGGGSTSKESDHLSLSLPSSGEASMVTDALVDLTGVDEVEVEWECDTASNVSAIIASTVKADDLNEYDARTTDATSFSRKTSTLDVSALSGDHYIRVHLQGTFTPAELKVYRVTVIGGNALVAAVETDGDDGEYIGSPTLGVTGGLAGDTDTAVIFNGVDQYARLPQSLGAVTELRAELLFKTTAATGTIVEIKNGNSTTDLQLTVEMVFGGGVQVRVNGGAAGDTIISSSGGYNDDEWHHLVAGYNAARDKVELYLDGELADSEDGNASWSWGTFSYDVMIGASAQSDPDSTTISGFFAGSIDEVSIYASGPTAEDADRRYLLATNGRGFIVDQVDWTDRLTGTDATNPVPTIWADGLPITDLALHRNRLVICGGESVIFSGSGDFFNFYLEDATQGQGDSDPIEVPLSSDSVTLADFIIPFRKTLIVTTKAGFQFELNAPEQLTWQTVAITPSTAYQTVEGVRPAHIGNQLYLPATNDEYGQLLEYFYSDSEASNTAADITDHAWALIPGPIKRVATSPNQNTLLVLPDGGGNKLFMYRYHWSGNQKVQSAWSKIDFGRKNSARASSLIDIAVIRNECFALIEERSGEHEIVKLDITPPFDDAEPCLDRQSQLTGVYDGTDTTWTHPSSDPSIDTVMIDGKVIETTRPSDGVFVAAGVDLSASAAAVGRAFEGYIELSRPYMRDSQGNSLLDLTLQLSKVLVNHRRTRGYTVEISQANRGKREYAYVPRSSPEAEGVHQFFVMGASHDTSIKVVLTGPTPTTIAGIDYIATGTFRSA